MIRRPISLLYITVFPIWLLSLNTDVAAIHLPPVMHHVEIRSPTAQNLELVGQLGGTTNAVVVIGSYAYVGIGSRLVILDIADPQEPILVGQTMSLPGMVLGIAVDGSYPYSAIGHLLKLFGISIPLYRYLRNGVFDLP